MFCKKIQCSGLCISTDRKRTLQHPCQALGSELVENCSGNVPMRVSSHPSTNIYVTASRTSIKIKLIFAIPKKLDA
jgi:hypothetical protein